MTRDDRPDDQPDDQSDDQSDEQDGEQDGEQDQEERERRELELGMLHSGMTYRELWWRQTEIGGDASALELEAYVLGLLRAAPYQHDLIAQALNEHFLDAGMGLPVPYSGRWEEQKRWD